MADKGVGKLEAGPGGSGSVLGGGPATRPPSLAAFKIFLFFFFAGESCMHAALAAVVAGL